MNKRDLQRLEGLLLLALLHKTKNKRLSASVVGISVDTLTKYINFLEDDIGEKLQLNHKNSCAFTSKACELVAKLNNLDIENWVINNRKINIFDLKNIRGIFYLKAISSFTNKRNASQMLATSVETINLYIDYLQNSLGSSLMVCDNQGSYLTNDGFAIIFKFDRIIKFINRLIKQKTDKHKTIRLALEKGIDISLALFNRETEHDILVFSDNPDLHLNDWDIAISFSEPKSDGLTISYKRKIKCGFFTSADYLTNFGTPQNLDDIKQNHLILDGRTRPYADKNYCEFIDDCQNTKFIENSNIAILDTVGYGMGICLVPLIVPKNNLIYLDHLTCDAEATIYLSIHKSFNNILKYRQAIANYQEILSSI
ncbi:MAG: hypothetical protein IKA30_02605 [Alphaproteobacteria bacterium]|nr:hypothetical protein [Alphaproteobacteria bacterium]